ncbi:2,4-dienoyl-CoA reductase-like NADH-dependent reductase (Old Yellow Enzyme family) [Pseudoduganella flava]|uniref:2,4-dienoyl-CoA reductase-like NADH-dependent reductase (Old Yellow Enzyme family) n=1 Tax=Pseudoduganella flava TaxID=871742 RepID=A0A562PCY7_9BURK|nr:NADH:flavin oxidoreductase/NADH oxidase [Pseudoduganella flava]QGZ40061.1 oxidoreductase [Pseudoduganella flava]TWI42193.1 2,4-dienoyl-CoA reductase-like NADH-dependent reductase (Old Yellow Enzyme family) [Pseudoduganella flava]
MSQLFSPFTLGSLQLKNRIAIAPMCQYSAVDGHATEWHMIHLGHLALSGAALLTLEATAVSPEGRISPRDLGLWSDAHARSLQPVIAAIRKHSPVRLAVQIAHAGRKASSNVPWEGGANIAPGAGEGNDRGWQTVAPSAVPHAEGETVPLALDDAGLAKVKDDFVATARRVHALGIEAIEVHGAHGYLLHQFLSPLANQRTDRYGGSLENRMRFPLEVFEAVRNAVPKEVAVGMRISATDWVEGGWDVEQSIVFANALKELGTDFIHVSSGGVSPRQKIPVGPGYQIQFAERIRHATGLPTIGVGLITEPEHAESIILQGQADMVALARGILYDPRWPWHAAAKLGAQVDAPPQYWRSQPHDLKQLFGATRLGQR